MAVNVKAKLIYYLIGHKPLKYFDLTIYISNIVFVLTFLFIIFTYFFICHKGDMHTYDLEIFP